MVFQLVCCVTTSLNLSHSFQKLVQTITEKLVSPVKVKWIL